ncbi:hypothetical protein IAT40_004228 [Kwoniella sp. CBS 6097]
MSSGHSSQDGEVQTSTLEPQLAERPRKRRKQRPHYSCDDCRRLKMKCDRKVPCGNCIRRHREQECIDGGSKRSLPVTHQPSPTSDKDRRREPAETPNSAIDARQPTLQRQHQTSDVHGMRLRFNSSSAYHTSLGIGSALGDLCPPSLSAGHSQNDQTTIHAGEMQPSDFVPSIASDSAAISSDLSLPTQGCPEPPHEQPISQDGLLIGGDEQVEDNPTEDSGFGTLVLSRGGRSKYLGPTAGSEWLKDSETQDNLDTPWVSRAPSPEGPALSQHAPAPLSLHPIAFPFNTSTAHISTKSLLSELPSREEAVVLIKSYYRYCAWHHDVIPRANFEKVFDRIYDSLPSTNDAHPSVAPQELALVYIVLAQGTLFNIEMPYNDSSAEVWLQLSERALVKSDFFANNTIPAIQTLHLMAHYHLHIDKGRRGDYAWPLWGLVMRLIQAMGMHRDGARWNLPEDVVEERRKVFWECRTADTFQAHCFSRP